jgi:hypothetical protein
MRLKRVSADCVEEKMTRKDQSFMSPARMFAMHARPSCIHTKIRGYASCRANSVAPDMFVLLLLLLLLLLRLRLRLLLRLLGLEDTQCVGHPRTETNWYQSVTQILSNVKHKFNIKFPNKQSTHDND